MRINRTFICAALYGALCSTLCSAAVGQTATASSTATSAIGTGSGASEVASQSGPLFSADGKLQMPADYRRWIYLSSGFDMSYNKGSLPGHHMFGNVFVNPEAWSAFQKTGSWPDKTVLVLEFRGAGDRGSIVKGGQYQTDDVMGLEVHVRDDAHFKDRWAFFSFDDGSKPAEVIPHSEDCYACHTAHAAVDTTFVQFYPTLMGLATSHSTLAPGYLKER